MFGKREPSKQVPPGLTPEECQSILQEAGYKAKLEQGQTSKFVKSAINGVNFSVHFYWVDSATNRARSIQFIAYFKTSMPKEKAIQVANKWNGTKRYAKVSVDQDNDFQIDVDFDLAEGVVAEQVGHMVEHWGALLAQFIQFEEV